MTYIQLSNIYFRYDEEWILNGISFSGSKGELIALVGPSGCGKTTLLRIIVGTISPQKGSIILNDEDITKIPIEHRQVGYVPQNQSLFPHLTVYENIGFGLRLSKTENRVRIMELSQYGGIKHILSRKPHEISGGQQQRVALLRALAPVPRLLLLDEPLSNVDTHLREQLALYIRSIQTMEKLTTIFVTHDINEAKMLADRIIVMEKGTILQSGTPFEVTNKPQSLQVARSLGLQNLFPLKIKQVSEGDHPLLYDSEIGELQVSSKQKMDSFKDITGCFIDPTKIKIDEQQFPKDLNKIGKILAIFPDRMTNLVTIIVQLRGKNDPNKRLEDLIPETSANSNHLFPTKLHIQIPLEETSFAVGDIIPIRIPPEAITFFR
ncbi:ABC transporter ATP-binding protein [Candidatus Hodarchaeum mangrovi]